LVAGKIIVEIKSVEQFNPVYVSQLLTYLRLTRKSLGLVINFGERHLKTGFHRVVNNFPAFLFSQRPLHLSASALKDI
jgi:GxxExxY protein